MYYALQKNIIIILSGFKYLFLKHKLYTGI